MTTEREPETPISEQDFQTLLKDFILMYARRESYRARCEEEPDNTGLRTTFLRYESATSGFRGQLINSRRPSVIDLITSTEEAIRNHELAPGEELFTGELSLVPELEEIPPRLEVAIRVMLKDYERLIKRQHGLADMLRPDSANPVDPNLVRAHEGYFDAVGYMRVALVALGQENQVNQITYQVYRH